VAEATAAAASVRWQVLCFLAQAVESCSIQSLALYGRRQ
jgi:hypothetical protein